LAPGARADDGKFEVTPVYHRSPFSLAGALLRAPTTGLGGREQSGHFAFRTTKRTLVQLDGEIRTLDPDVEGRIDLERRLLHCIV
jgi:hypothetical protein